MIEPPEVPHSHAHHEGPPRQGWMKWVFEAIMPISVLLLSIGSLYVALHTGTAMDKLVAHNEKLVKAQSTPILTYSTSNFDDQQQRPALKFEVANVGTGPARLHWVRVHQAQRSYPHFFPWLESLSQDPAALSSADWLTGTLDGAVLPAREVRTGLYWARPAERAPAQLALWQLANQARGQLQVEFCYCSVFDECWQERVGAGPARPVPRCEAPAQPAASAPTP